MTVGTQGTVKGVFTDDILATGAQIILGNTYHLLLKTRNRYYLKNLDGLHEFHELEKTNFN